MRKFFSFRTSYGSGNDNSAPSNPNRSRKKSTNPGTISEIDVKTSSQEGIYDGFHIPEGYVLKTIDQNLENDASSKPYLRRSQSFTSRPNCNLLNEGSFSSSTDQSRIAYCRDSDQNEGRFAVHNQSLFTPDRYSRSERENLVLNVIEKSISHSPSAHQISSDSNSACNSPIPLKCRTARPPPISQSGVLDLYIDGEHVIKTDNDSRKCPSETGKDCNCKVDENNKVSIAGRPPRSLCDLRSYSFREVKNKRHHLSSRDLIRSDLKPIFQHKYLENGMESTLHISGIQECDSQTSTPIEDSFEDSSDGTDHGRPFDLILLDKKFQDNLLHEPFDLQRQVLISRKGLKAMEHDEMLNFKFQEPESNEGLLKKLKELEERCLLMTKEDPEIEKLLPGSLKESSLLQIIWKSKEDSQHLAAELFLQIRGRLAERSFTNERLKQSKLDLITRTRRLESEKNELQLSLENELDRRSNEWSVKLSKIQAEEQRLRERVRELAEQNVSLQREISSLQGNDTESRNAVVNMEKQLSESRASQDELKAESFNLRQTLLEVQERCSNAEEQRDYAKRSSKEMERESVDLQKLVCRLQKTCSEQDKTINSLKQSYNNELEIKLLEGDSDVFQLQSEKIRMVGLEQKLRRELESCRAEMETLRNENFHILNRLQGNKNTHDFSLIRLSMELHSWVDCLKVQSLPLLDDSCSFCGQLLNFIAGKRSENCEYSNSDADKYSAIDMTLRYQSLRRAIGNFRRSLKVVSTTLEEKLSIHSSKCTCQTSGTDPLKNQKSHEFEDDIEVKLKAESLLSKLLREKMCFKEVEVEQLQGDLASSVRRCDMLCTDIQRLKDEVSCLNHKKMDMEIQMLRKDEDLQLLQQDLRECMANLNAAGGTLTMVSGERDRFWEEMKQLRENSMLMECELKSLHKKIELLDEDVLYKEGQISILKDSLDNKRFDTLVCSPETEGF